jgi:hypothetical protein
MMNPMTRLVAARAVAILLPALIATAGCGSRRPASDRAGGDPIDALTARTVSTEYDEAYWGEQRRSDSEIWRRATSYCDGKDANEHPNCRPVLSLLLLDRTLDRPATSSPGFDGSTGMSGRADSAQSRLDSLRSAQ